MTNTTPEQARDFAIAAHADQKYGDQPYVYHLDAVAQFCEPYGEQAVIVAFLHDVVEDTDTTQEAIASHFGETIARLVGYLTDAEGLSREETKEKTNSKLSKISQYSVDSIALIVKAADRLANLSESVRTNFTRKLEMYRNEHPEFQKAVYRPGLCDDLWEQIKACI